MDLIKKRKLAKRYAGVFLTEKMGKDAILTLAAEMQFVADTLRANPDLAEFFAAPAVSRADKLKVVTELCRKGGFTAYTRELLEILVRHGRAEIIVLVSRELHFIADEILNRIRVWMTTAADPSTTEIEGLSRRVGTFFRKNVFVERHHDPSLLGGFVLEGDGKRVDLSIRGQLEALLDKV